MKPFTTHTGRVVAMDRSNVDTDQIIPKQFLKRIERTGFGEFLFYDWRYHPDGTSNEEFELNQPQSQGASILVARKNFGSGSSREHAVWALDDYGIRCVIAESFADIFYNNCTKNGVLPVVLKPEEVREIHDRVKKYPGYELSIDLDQQKVTDTHGFEAHFEIDPFRKQCLFEGLDQIALTLKQEDRISEYERQHDAVSPPPLVGAE